LALGRAFDQNFLSEPEKSLPAGVDVVISLDIVSLRVGHTMDCQQAIPRPSLFHFIPTRGGV